MRPRLTTGLPYNETALKPAIGTRHRATSTPRRLYDRRPPAGPPPCLAGDRIVAILQTHTPPEWGRQPEPHGELVTVRDGKVTEMVVYPTVDEALVAAGLSART